jgi:DNA-binding MarR family transcriptional regulator
MSDNNKETPQLLLENQICFPLYAAANAVVRAYRPLLEKLDLTYLQYIVLMVLWEEETLNVKSLGQRLRLDSGTLTPLLKRLDAKGYVERRHSEIDERIRVISLTRQGKALKSRAEGIPHELVCTVGLSATKGRELKEICDELIRALAD